MATVMPDGKVCPTRLGKLAWREQAKKHRYSGEVSEVTVSRRSSLGSGVAEVVSRPFLSGRGL